MGAANSKQQLPVDRFEAELKKFETQATHNTKPTKEASVIEKMVESVAETVPELKLDTSSKMTKVHVDKTPSTEISAISDPIIDNIIAKGHIDGINVREASDIAMACTRVHNMLAHGICAYITPSHDVHLGPSERLFRCNVSFDDLKREYVHGNLRTVEQAQDVVPNHAERWHDIITCLQHAVHADEHGHRV